MMYYRTGVGYQHVSNPGTPLRVTIPSRTLGKVFFRKLCLCKKRDSLLFKE